MDSKKTLDPSDWPAFRAQAHIMLDDILTHLEQLRERPVWQSIPARIRTGFAEKLPQQGQGLAALHQRFMHEIAPYSIGNTHPGFMGWVQGGGTPVGMLAEMLAAGLNPNLGGRDQIPIVVEQQILVWMRELFHFPDSANGLFVTGTSLANFIAVIIARTQHLGRQVRQRGLDAQRLTAYASSGAHGCIAKAMDLAGLGTDALRLIPMNLQYQIDLNKLSEQIQADQAAGYQPFLIVGTAGSVDVGSIDDLTGLADLAETHDCWFHVDGAYGALGMMSPHIAPRLAGIERAASIAFDFHKWGQVPYDAGYILVRDGTHQLDAFSTSVNYLKRETRGMAAGAHWPCDLGPDLSRGFRALKTWFTIAAFGAEKLGEVIYHTCQLAQYLATQIQQEPKLELLAPVNLNIVCFRYVGDRQAKHLTTEQTNALNNELLIQLQEGGVVAPSSTLLGEQFALRAALVNHRTTQADVDNLIRFVLMLGNQILD
jgi:aromatic-L-amino-acid decarboxylase